ncbi:MAG TPA: hypothetical protein VFY76_08555 [Nocardioides sp.]|nr:hypothetical protein [Nocardioides sp.]
MELLLLVPAVAAVVIVVLLVRRRGERRQRIRQEKALAPVRMLAFEDVTAFGVDLADLDSEISGHELDEGATADYERALDAYEVAKIAGDALTEPDDVRHLTETIEDGRYAIACVRARVSGEPLPTRRPPCFFDPRHGLSVADVPYTPADGTERQVPACALDTQRIHAGAEPDTRKVPVGSSRVPYWQGGPAYAPYAAGYFGADALTWLFIGSLAFDDFDGGGPADNVPADTGTGTDGAAGHGDEGGFFDGGDL